MMIEKPESFDQLEDQPVEQQPERVPDALEIATREAARRQERQLRGMGRRDRCQHPTNHRTTRRREGSC